MIDKHCTWPACACPDNEDTGGTTCLETPKFSLRELNAHVNEARRQALALAKTAALEARLPEGFQWGTDAMEQFEFGKKQAAEAIARIPAGSSLPPRYPYRPSDPS